MRKGGIATKAGVIVLALAPFLIPQNSLKAQAAEVMATVYGTVSEGTTAELLLLSTQQGKMEIKLDAGTDTSSCKILLPGKQVYVSVSRGSDAYLHAVKITNDSPVDAAAIDYSTSVTVTGKLSEKTKEDLLYLDTAQGQMEIRLDAATNMENCSVLVAGEEYRVTCARGSDAYMHAVSISDKETTVSAPPNGEASVTTVSGTVTDNTKEALLYLSTSGGEMQFVIDSSTDTSSGRVLTPGRKLTVSFYRGSDAYLHASRIVGEKSGNTGVSVDTSSTVTVTGTVDSRSNENLLYLNTPQGTMELKLDVLSSMNNCKALVSGKKISVSCAHGSDAYLHAVNITGV